MMQFCHIVPSQPCADLHSGAQGEPSQQIWLLVSSAAMAVLSDPSALCPRLSISHLFTLPLFSSHLPLLQTEKGKYIFLLSCFVFSAEFFLREIYECARKKKEICTGLIKMSLFQGADTTRPHWSIKSPPI